MFRLLVWLFHRGGAVYSGDTTHTIPWVACNRAWWQCSNQQKKGEIVFGCSLVERRRKRMAVLIVFRRVVCCDIKMPPLTCHYKSNSYSSSRKKRAMTWTNVEQWPWQQEQQLESFFSLFLEQKGLSILSRFVEVGVDETRRRRFVPGWPPPPPSEKLCIQQQHQLSKIFHEKTSTARSLVLVVDDQIDRLDVLCRHSSKKNFVQWRH